ncbi:MAG: SRPBCC family protein [Acidimicrobiia bacterium]
MSEQATERTTINAGALRCYEVAADIERYPEWAEDIKEAQVLSRDDENRPLEVAFRTAAMGRSTNYTLKYDYAQAPKQLSWSLVEGDLTERLDGTYTFNDRDTTPETTEVTYTLEVGLVVPLPGFVKRRAEAKILRTALPELKARVEALDS